MKRTYKRFAWDIDGVFAAFNPSFIALIKEQTGMQLPPESDTYPASWSYHLDAGVTRDQDKRLWETISSSEDFWALLGTFKDAPQALAVINDLASLGHEMYFVTSRPGFKAKKQTEDWLRRHGVDDPTVIIADNSEAKGRFCKALSIDVFVDDRPENVAAVATMSPSTSLYLFAAPYNTAYQALAATGTIKVVKSALEVVEREIAEGMPLAA